MQSSNSKLKSGASDTSNNKTIPATPRSSKLGRAASTKSDLHSSSPLQNSRLSIDCSPKSFDSKPKSGKLGRAASTNSDSHSSSPLQNSCLSVDCSPKSVVSKPILEHRSPKLSIPPDKQPRALKGSELQAKIYAVQEDLKKATEQLALVEQEKAQALKELKDAKGLAGEVNDKLKEALVAQKRAEENSQIEQFRADELEQAGIDAAQKRESEWQKEFENVQNQHAVDHAALLSAMQELQKVKHELEMTSDAKNTALKHADDAMKIAEINAEKVAFLSGEVSHLKELLDSKMENMTEDTAELVKKLDREVDILRNELDREKVAKEKLVDMEMVIELLRSEVSDAKKAEMHADNLVDEWKRKTELLEAQLEEANISENKTAELVKQLDSEIDGLRDELERANAAEEKLIELEALVEGLKTQITDARMAEMDADKLVDKWKSKGELLALQVEEANHSASRTQEQVKKLDSELEALKHELEVAKGNEEKLVEVEAQVERLRTEMTNANRSEIDALKLVDEWKRKVGMLEAQLEEANQSEKSSLDSLALLMKQLEENHARQQDAESEIVVLKGMVVSLEAEVSRHKADLEALDRQLDIAKREASELGNTVEVLKTELRKLEEEKLQYVNNEKFKASNTEKLLEEMNRLINELEITKDEMEKSKVTMEGLTSDLKKVSTEVQETQERFLIKQVEFEEAHTEIKKLRSSLESTKEEYDTMLDEARYENVCLRNSIERCETEAKTSRADWYAKELDFVSTMKRSEEQLSSLKIEMGKMVNSLKGVEHEAQAAKEAENNMVIKLRQAEYGEAVANEAAEEAKSESLWLKERLLDKENELQSITQENGDLRIQEAASLQKVRELSLLLAEATVRMHQENGELSNSGNEYGLLQKKNLLQEENTTATGVEKTKPEIILGNLEDSFKEDAKQTEGNGNGNLNKEEQTVKVEAKILENCTLTDKDLGSQREHKEQSTDDKLDLKIDSSRRDHINGLASERMENGTVSRLSPTEAQLQKKKKKALLQKFGSLLKKKSNHKERKSLP